MHTWVTLPEINATLLHVTSRFDFKDQRFRPGSLGLHACKSGGFVSVGSGVNVPGILHYILSMLVYFHVSGFRRGNKLTFFEGMRRTVEQLWVEMV